MVEKLTLTLHEAKQSRVAFTAARDKAQELIGAGKRLVLVLRPETRTEAQNRLMWPLLQCFSDQLEWPINGRMEKMAPEDWKDVLTAAFKGESIRLAMGLNVSPVMLGQRTSRFSKKEFGEWIDFLYSTAADRDVQLPAWTWER